MMSDNLIVNRNGQTYQVDMTNTKAIEATDLLLVNRDGTTYTVTGDQISAAQFETVTLAPLTGIPNFEITAVTDITSIPDGATARYCWYQYDEATGYAGKVKLQERVLTTTQDTYTVVSPQQGKYVGCEVTYLGTTVNETQRTAVDTADVPIARMHGLRFDEDRGTYFSRLVTPGQLKTYTISFWLKPTFLSNSRPYAVGLGSVSDPAFFAYFNPPDVTATGGRMTVYHGSSVQSYRTMTEEIPFNVWTHVVVAYDAPSQTMRVYLNGQDPDVFTSFGAPVDLASGQDYYIIGSATDGGSHYGGYMSDFYFIQDRALTPELFGQQFLLGWGPLDYSAVLDNIASVEQPTTLSPYETRPNMERIWSAGTPDYDYIDWAPVFDDDVDTYVTGVQGTFQYSDFMFESPIPVTESLELFASARNGNSNTVGFQTDLSGNNWVNLPKGFLNTGTNEWSNNLLELADFTGISTINKIRVYYDDGNSGSYLGAIKVDGRMLVDGPANNSQMWSPLVTTDNGAFYAGSGPEKAFNGNDATSAGSATLGSLATLTVDGLGFTGDSVVEVNTVSGSIEINDVVVQTGDLSNGVSGPFTITNFNKLTVNGHSNTSFSASLYYIKVDGKILVDSGYQWNTSQVWSKNQTGNTYPNSPGYNYDWANAFDGNLDLVAYASNTSGNTSVKFNSPVTGVTRIFANQGSDSPAISTPTIEFYLDGVVVNISGTSVPLTRLNKNWTTIENGDSITWDEIKLLPSDDAGAELAAIEVDGQILVDETVPWNTSEIWSNNTDKSKWYPGQGPENMFDGSLDTRSFTNQNGELTYVQLGSITVNEKIEVYGTVGTQIDGDWDWVVTVDGSNYPVSDTPGGAQWWTVQGLTFPCNLEAIGNNYSGGVSAIVVDGSWLIDAGSLGANGFFLPFDPEAEDGIGADLSGNSNDLGSENFAVGNTSQVWSDYGINADVDYNWRLAFNGKLGNTYADGVTQAGNATDYAKFIPPGGIVAQESLRLYHISGPTANMFVVSGGVDTFINYPNTTGWADPNITYPYNLEEIRIGNQGDTWTYLMAVEVDGVLLVNGNIQDTVLDTPMNNYAVGAVNGKNGNLVSDNVNTMHGTIGVSSGKYYSESYIASDASYSLVGVIDANGYGTSEGYVVYESTGQISDLTSTSTYYSTYGRGDVIGCAWDVDRDTIGFFKNGEFVGSYSPTNSPLSNGWTFGVFGPDTAANFGQQTFAGSNVIDNGDGTVTILKTIPNTSRVWSDGLEFPDGRFANDITCMSDDSAAFDGDTSIGVCALNTGKNLICNFDPPITGVFEWWSRVDSSTYARTCIITDDAGTRTIPAPGNSVWLNFGLVTNLTKLEVTGNNPGGGTIDALRLDGQLLVDSNLGDPTQNTSQYWTGGVKLNGNYAADGTGNFPGLARANQMFDGSTGAGDGTDSWGPGAGAFNGTTQSTVQIDFSEPITGEFKVVAAIADGTTESGFTVYHSGGTTFVSCASIGIANYGGMISGNLGTFTNITRVDPIYANNGTGGGSGLYIAGWFLNDIILVDGIGGFPGGTFKKLQQTWTEQKAVVFYARIAAADLLMNALRDHAQTYSATEDYCEGTVISAFGQLWISVADAPAATFADKPALLAHPNWEQLNVSV